MKNLTIILMCLLLGNTLFSQEKNNDIIGRYLWKEAVLMTASNIDGTPHATDTTPVLSEKGQRFDVINVKEGIATIKILDYTVRIEAIAKTNKDKLLLGNTSNIEKELRPRPEFFIYNVRGFIPDNSISNIAANAREYGLQQRYFTVTLDRLQAHAIKDEEEGFALNLGALNFPFKLRPQIKDGGDFSGSFNLGVSIGFRIPSKTSKDWKHNFMMGYSISETVLDSVSVEREKAYKLASNNKFISLSLSTGYVIEYKKVQAGIFIGIDRLNRINQADYGWKYQNKPWLSIGFGYAIFTRENKSEKGDNVQKPN